MIPKNQNPLFIMADDGEKDSAEFAGICAVEYLMSLKLKGELEKLTADPLFEEILSSIHEVLSSKVVIGVELPLEKKETTDGSESVG